MTPPRWDLTHVFPSLDSTEFQNATEKLKTQLTALEQFLDQHGIRRLAPNSATPADFAAHLAEYIEQLNATLATYSTLSAYVASFITTDAFNALAKRRMSEIQMLGVRLEQLEVRFQGWIGSLVEALPTTLAQNAHLQPHAFYLSEAARQSKYLMSETEEGLASELSLSGALAWQKLQHTVCAQITVPFERNGQVEKMPMAALQNLLREADPDLRRRAYDAELAAWETVREPLAAALNGVKGMQSVLDRRRGRADALHESLDQGRIDRETLEAMMSAIREAFPTFRRYLKGKAQRLGHTGGLPWWDLYAPTNTSHAQYTFAEAEAFIEESFGRFGPRLAQMAQQAFQKQWIDAEARAGKQGGAFCMELPALEESRILCNFDGSLDQLSTLAHELGHAFHNECLRGATMLQRRFPITLAETASIFCETLITDALLARVTNPQEEAAILEAQIANANQVTVDITSRYLFEQEVFTRRASAELSADDLCEIMLRAQDASYGEGLDARYRHPYMWAWKPHYYNLGFSFYNYPYAFGLLFSLGLYAIYQERGAAFVADYENLLASTGQGTAADLAARFGLNLRQPDFWRGSLKIVEKQIDRYLAL